MTSPRKRQANRANALRSTGPKSPAGMRAASLNATSHGLSVATDPDSLDPAAERVAVLIASEGIAPAAARELAARVIDFERNMAHQRALRMERPPGPMQSMQATSADAAREQANPRPPETLSGDALLTPKLSAMVQKIYVKTQRDRSIRTERYILRATNQLIKGLKRL